MTSPFRVGLQSNRFYDDQNTIDRLTADNPMNPNPFSELLELSIPERIRLVEDLWDSIARDAGAVPLTDWQRRELDACLDEYTADPDDGESWLKVKDDILGRR